MSTLQSAVPNKTMPGKAMFRNDAERGHRFRVRLAALTSFLFLTGLLIYGASYYRLPLDERPFSDKHMLLRPSGTIGLKLGILGTALFVIIFLYALRKVIPWLGRIGTARHWMDFHVICGVSAPIVIALHASFKFQGIAGIAYWIMVAVALSGIVGRYLYSQIPRSLTAAELSLSDLQSNEEELSAALLEQSVFSAKRLARILDTPSAEHIRNEWALAAIVEMLMLDMRRPFQIAALRRSSSDFVGNLRSIGGILHSANPEVERIVTLVRQKASLSKRIIFLDKTRRVFNLWHVIHRPFSYAFAALAIMHIAVVMGLGFL